MTESAGIPAPHSDRLPSKGVTQRRRYAHQSMQNEGECWNYCPVHLHPLPSEEVPRRCQYDPPNMPSEEDCGNVGPARSDLVPRVFMRPLERVKQRGCRYVVLSD
jgi:hypothetical protein